MQIPDVPPQLLAALSEAAAGQRLALVGGVVRDLLLHRHHQDPWRGLSDLDLVVEGSAADLVERLPQALMHQLGQPVSLCKQLHDRYDTVAMELHFPVELGGIWLLDLASARREFYLEPARNPMVSPGTLEQDLARRDFTVNAMALVLPSDAAPEAELLDPHGGQADLAERRLRFLHNDSLRDDPTRLLRAARYAARMGFDLAPEALEQAQTTLADWPWPWHLGDDPAEAPPALATRLRMELELLLEREPWPQALALLQQWGGLGLLDPGLQRDHGWRRSLRRARRFDLPLLTVFVASAEEALPLAQRLQLPHRAIRLIHRFHDLCTRLDQITEFQDAPSFWTDLLEAPGTTAEAVALAVVCGQRPRRPLLQWLFHWRHVTAGLTAQQLMAEEGLRPGPDVGRRLAELRQERLDQC